jgi:hypothetical protein
MVETNCQIVVGRLSLQLVKLNRVNCQIMIGFLAIWIFVFLGMSTSNASIYTGSFKQSEFRYVKSIEGHTCAYAYRPFRERIVAPSGWYFEIAPDSLCSFRLTQVKKKRTELMIYMFI